MASKKVVFTQGIIETSTMLSQAIGKAIAVRATYFDRGYNGGGDTITSGDLASMDGIEPADIAAFITMAEQLDNFAHNSAVTTGDYSATLNKLRNDL